MNIFGSSHLDVPSAPRDLSVSDITKTTAMLKWAEPESDGGSPITNYVVEKCTNFNSRWVKACKATVTDTTVTLSDLVEGTSYEFKVYAENEAGPGPACKPVGPVEAKEPHGELTSVKITFIKCKISPKLRVRNDRKLSSPDTCTMCTYM